MAKATLKHRIEGTDTIATRSTARAYTHVLVGRVNQARAAAETDAQEARIPARLAAHRKQLATYRAIYNTILATPVGGQYRNWNGYVVTCTESDKQLAEQRLAEDDNAYAEDYEQQLRDDVARAREKNAHERSWVVYSWHGSFDAADKASRVSRYDSVDFRIEEINGGA